MKFTVTITTNKQIEVEAETPEAAEGEARNNRGTSVSVHTSINVQPIPDVPTRPTMPSGQQKPFIPPGLLTPTSPCK